MRKLKSLLLVAILTLGMSGVANAPAQETNHSFRKQIIRSGNYIIRFRNKSFALETNHSFQKQMIFKTSHAASETYHAFPKQIICFNI